MGVYVLVSRDPNLIQIRYGERIRLEAYRSGLAVGGKYSQIQRQFKNQGADLGTLNTLKELSQELPSALNLPWYLRYGKTLVAVTFSEFEELVSPSDGMYSKWILRPYLKLIQFLGGFFSVWYFILLNLCLYFSVNILFAKALPNVILRKSKPKAKAVWKTVISIVINALFAVPFFGSVILLNGSRFEDYLALKQLGISSPDQASLGVHWFLNVTGFWLAAFVMSMNYINLWISDPLREPLVIYCFGTSTVPPPLRFHQWKQRQRYPTLFYKSSLHQIDVHTFVIVYDKYAYRPRFSVLVFLLFMPKAIGLVGVLKESFDLVGNILSKKSALIRG